MSESAKRAGVSRQAAYVQRETSPEFAAAWDDAIEQGIEALELEVRRRALDGCEEPVVSQGEIIATTRKYSDTLAIFLLKAHRPDRYRERRDVAVTGADGGPVETVTRVVFEWAGGAAGDPDDDDSDRPADG